MRKWLVLCLVICVILSSACRSTARTTPAPPAPTATPSLSKATVTPTDAPTPTAVPPTATPTLAPPTPIPPGEDESLRQWAIAANASSEYGDTVRAAMQATGAPDTPECGLSPTAWTSAEPDGYDWIELIYAEPVIPTALHIYESHSPGFIYAVHLSSGGDAFLVLGGGSPPAETCPRILSLEIDDLAVPVDRVLILVDQRVGGAWNAIDAVELVGIPGDFPPFVEDVDTPNLRLWRLTYPEDFEDDAFIALSSVALAPNGLLYVADGEHGVYILDAENGGGIARIHADGLLWASALAFAPDGTLYVADSIANAVFVFDPNGAPRGRFGRAGRGPGDFGGSGPQALAVGPDGNVYVLDEHRGARVLVFDSSGVFLRSFTLPGDAFGARDLAFGPDGILYVLGAAGGYIEAYNREGKQVGYVIGEEELRGAWPQRLALDAAGNFYVTVWLPEPAVLRLDTDGFATGRFGPELGYWHPRYGTEPLEAPYAIAVRPDGKRLFVTDLSDWFTLFALTLDEVRTVPPPTTAEVLWQVGSTSPELAGLEFSTFGGMDASDTAVYVADAYNGAFMFDFTGTFQGILGLGEAGYVVDVAVGPGGEVYIADAGMRLIGRFDAEGDFLGAFFGSGTGDGEFSGDSPAALAVDSDGNVYALDIGDAGTRVQVFTPEGDFIRAFPVEAELQARAMEIGPDGTLFLTGFGGYILELIPADGRVIQRLGQETLGDAFPQRLRVDDDGNFYVTTWGMYAAVKLDRQGRLLETIGVEGVNDGVTGWPPGEFLFPVGIAVTGDGRYLFIGDGFREFAFVTAYDYP